MINQLILGGLKALVLGIISQLARVEWEIIPNIQFDFFNR